MKDIIAQPKFTNAQLEILRLFRENLSEEKLAKLRRVLANFLLDEVFKEAENAASKRGFDQEMLHKIVKGDV
jgi:hypothetical protein